MVDRMKGTCSMSIGERKMNDENLTLVEKEKIESVKLENNFFMIQRAMRKLKMNPRIVAPSEEEMKEDPDAKYRMSFYLSDEDPNIAFEDIPDSWFTEFADAYNDVNEQYFTEVVAPVLNDLLGIAFNEKTIINANELLIQDTMKWTDGESLADFMSKLIIQYEPVEE